MRERIVPFTVALLLLAAGCSSSDPTASDEYTELEQELAQANQELAQAEDQLAEVAAETVAPTEEVQGVVAPEGLAALIDGWYAALGRGDDSVLELYLPEGYHRYGDKRFEYDEIPGHLQGGGIEHVWITEPLLITDEGDGRYVVVRGMRNTSPSDWSSASAVSFEIVTTADDELRLVQTGWFYDSEWSDG